jgi:hypothetical protein
MERRYTSCHCSMLLATRIICHCRLDRSVEKATCEMRSGKWAAVTTIANIILFISNLINFWFAGQVCERACTPWLIPYICPIIGAVRYLRLADGVVLFVPSRTLARCSQLARIASLRARLVCHAQHGALVPTTIPMSAAGHDSALTCVLAPFIDALSAS